MTKYCCFFLLFISCQLSAQTPPVFDSLQLTYGDTLYFESAKWSLDTGGIQTVQQFPEPQNEKERVYLTGHTDAIGSIEYNERLAQKRAQSVKDTLLTKNWTDEMIVIQTFGERLPTASNESDEDRKLNRRVLLELYKPVPYISINGKVFNPDSDELISNAQIRIHSRSISDSLVTDEKGNFVLNLPVDSVIGMDVYAEGYFFKTHMMKVKPGMESLLKIPLQKAAVGAAADLSKLYFVGNEAILLEYSKSELPKIKRFLEINNHLKVEIAGHVNYPNLPPVTEDTFEWKLSVRRAQFLYNWLLEQGIPQDQITYKGYGNHEMKYPKATSQKEQELNRRVEIRVVGERG